MLACPPLPMPGADARGLEQTQFPRWTAGGAAHPAAPSSNTPPGSENANTGAQSRPSDPSGSTVPNPGAAFVAPQPRSAVGPSRHSAGKPFTTAVQRGRTTTCPEDGVGEEGAGRIPSGAHGRGREAADLF